MTIAQLLLLACHRFDPIGSKVAVWSRVRNVSKMCNAA